MPIHIPIHYKNESPLPQSKEYMIIPCILYKAFEMRQKSILPPTDLPESFNLLIKRCNAVTVKIIGGLNHAN